MFVRFFLSAPTCFSAGRGAISHQKPPFSSASPPPPPPPALLLLQICPRPAIVTNCARPLTYQCSFAMMHLRMRTRIRMPSWQTHTKFKKSHMTPLTSALVAMTAAPRDTPSITHTRRRTILSIITTARATVYTEPCSRRRSSSCACFRVPLPVIVLLSIVSLLDAS